MSGRFDIEYLLEEVVTLPSLPDTVVRVSRMADDPKSALREVAAVIAADPALALKTLRLVNSAYYGLGQQITTIEHAVVLLGSKVIKNLALTATVFDTFKNANHLFLRHSVACALVMRALAENKDFAAAPIVTGDEAFVFGLLHDIGKVVLQEYLPDEAEKIPAVISVRHLSWYEAEQGLLGVDHAQIGAKLAEKWKLSPLLANAIESHHDLDRCADEVTRVLAASIAVADYICGACGLHSYVNPQYRVSDAVWELAGTRPERVAQLLDSFFAAYPAVDELVGLAA